MMVRPGAVIWGFTWGVAASLCGFGCGSGGEGDTFDFNTGTATSPGPTGGPTSTAGSDSGGTAADTGNGPGGTGVDGTSTAGDSGSGGSEDTGPGVVPGEPCVGVDLIFVIDNSETMAEEQSRLIGSASAWVNQLNTNIPSGVDGFHIGVLTTDDSTFKATDGEGTPCGPYDSGEPWIELGANLGTELACALNQGIAGDPDERPIENLLASVDDDALMPGGVHEGFLRDDALLVVVLMTDEEDDIEPATQWGSVGDPAEWADTIAAHKGGFKQNVVVLSLLGHEPPNACPPFQWDGMTGAEIATRLIDFTNRFPAGAVGDVCDLEYNSFLSSVVAGVAAACGNVAS
jgi:hypothetical protein